MKRELDHLARFMHMAVAYKKEVGFTGQFYDGKKGSGSICAQHPAGRSGKLNLTPFCPSEPTKHQYDFDPGAPGCINFIRSNGLEGHIKLNIETNHATLAGHTVAHELTYAAAHGFLGSIDANPRTPGDKRAPLPGRDWSGRMCRRSDKRAQLSDLQARGPGA